MEGSFTTGKLAFHMGMDSAELTQDVEHKSGPSSQEGDEDSSDSVS